MDKREHEFRAFIGSVLYDPAPPTPEDRTVLIQQYQIARSSVTDLQTDRNDQTKIYAVFLATLTAAYAYAFEKTAVDPVWWFAMLLFAFIGMLVSFFWKSHVTEIGLAMRVRYAILQSLEGYLPANVFEADRLGRQKGRELFKGGHRNAAEIVKALPGLSLWFFGLLFIWPGVVWMATTAASSSGAGS